MIRLPAALVLLLGSGLVAGAAPVPKDPTRDLEGNPLPKGATAHLGSLAFRGARISAVRFSDDGKRVLGWSGWSVFTWDAASGRLIETKSFAPKDEALRGEVRLVAGGRVFCTETHRHAGPMGEPVSAVVVRDRVTGREVRRFPCSDDIAFAPDYVPAQHPPSAAVSADGRYLALVSKADKAVDVFDTDTGESLHSQPIAAYHGGTVISPDNKTLYIYDATKPIRRCELVSGKDLPDLDGTGPTTDRVAVSPDGKRVLTRGTFFAKDEARAVQSVERESFLVLRDTVANKTIRKIELGAIPIEFAFAGPGAALVVSLKQWSPTSTVYVLSRWNVETAKKEWEVVAPAHSHLTVSIDGKRAALLRNNCVTHTFDTATGKPVADVAAHGAAVAWVGFSSDGQTVHTAGETEIMSWTLKGERKTLATPPELRHDRFQSFAPGAPLAWVTYSLSEKKSELVGWDTAKNAIGWRVPLGDTVPERLFTHDSKQIIGIGWNQDANNWNVSVFDGPAGKKLHRWDLKTKRETHLWPGLALTGDGKQLVLGDVSVKALDVTTGKEQLALSADTIPPVRAPGMPPLAISRDGTRWAVIQRDEDTGDSALNVHEVKTGKRLVSYKLEMPLYNPALLFSPNGKSVVLWTIWGWVLVFDTDSGAPRRSLEAREARPTCAAFSPNSASLAVGYQDGTTLLWDLTAK